MLFNRLRLSGFKSFVEPTDLVVEPGMTGIVGPNGCGKSNLVEALRWVMGENSPKRMRGDGMDDVIFAGSASRPARNIAEVSLLLDNADRSAPSQYNDRDEIEVVRRIEREQGSAYSINGNEVRQRDVLTLFADMATGAHSSAMVSQGQIAGLINAKPAERRQLLEEAAGITGLHARRHEAELRLKAAEHNLERLADIMAGHETNLRSLKRQAGQARKYARLSAQIRTHEAQLLLRLWADAIAELEAAQVALRDAERRVAETAEQAALASTVQAEAAQRVPPLRQAEAERAAALQRLRLERDAIDAEEQRARDAAERLTARIAHTDADSEREEAMGTDAAHHIAAIDHETGELTAAKAQEAEAIGVARARLAETDDQLRSADRAADALSESLTQAETRRASLSAAAESAEGRLTDLVRRAGEVADERARMGEVAPPDQSAEDQVPEIVAARGQVARATAALGDAETARAHTNEQLAAKRDALHEIEARHRRLSVEQIALNDVLRANQDDLFKPILDSVAVTPGFEAALAAALGDDLQASGDIAAPAHWQQVDRPAPALPEGAAPLSQCVSAPAAVALRLSQIGVVSGDKGAELRAQLAQGQRLVSRDGSLWRWDGYTTAPDAGTRAAVRLRQRNRLAELTNEVVAAKEQLDVARAAFDAAKAAAKAAETSETESRTALRIAEAALASAREAFAAAVREAVARSERAAALAQQAQTLATEIETLGRRAQESRAELATLPDAAALRAEIATARQNLDAARAAHAEAERTAARLAQEAGMRGTRLATLLQERGAWQARATAAEAQLEKLSQRRAADEAELKVLEAKPAELAEKRRVLLEATEIAEAERNAAADALAQAEAALAAADREDKRANEAAGAAREDRVRAEGRAEAAAERKDSVKSRMASQLQCGPDEAHAVAGLEPGAALPPADEVDATVERLKREREQMGPVNLRADVEAQELEAELTHLTTERDDLVGAIHKLRAGIGALNREGRERMQAAFVAVDRHFRELFGRLFGGGEAYLKLVDSEDVLEAGLEIMASPPGKRLQTLTLLSGGEQALTAVALRFAVFLTNPAPVCVMDEVDAPLDDANVGRFCDLVAEISRTVGTRFLVITHHPLSMARMDRLFGVTMFERGISQLVSVDLARAEKLREAV
ncbi:MAG: chromosome segregation protein SMC [Alphaproteobacteria bacterium]|nr:chromosome segregation protein SMC [Alphaproteobacteria bacterium]